MWSFNKLHVTKPGSRWTWCRGMLKVQRDRAPYIRKQNTRYVIIEMWLSLRVSRCLGDQAFGESWFLEPWTSHSRLANCRTAPSSMPPFYRSRCCMLDRRYCMCLARSTLKKNRKGSVLLWFRVRYVALNQEILTFNAHKRWIKPMRPWSYIWSIDHFLVQ